MKIIRCKNKYVPEGYSDVIVDDEDFERVNNYTWNISDEYARRTIWHGKRSTSIKLHQFIIGKAPQGLEIDHENKNKLDNRKCNLRVVTKNKNQQNRKKSKNCSSKYIGVCFDKNEKLWSANITDNNSKRIWLGRFDSEVEAAKAYDAVVDKYFPNQIHHRNFPK
jgi:hypothetical protein